MQELLEAITELVSNSPPNKVEQLANLIKKTSGVDLLTSASGWATTPVARVRLNRLLGAAAGFDIPAAELAGMLIGASYAYHQAITEESIELVWTGPSSELVATRKTEQALLQVILAAQERLFLTSFVAYNVASIMASLKDAIKRGVSLSMLLESSDQHGGGISIDTIGKMRKAFPEAKIYFWGDKTDAFAGGKVHAKVAVADDRICFISSANLTGHAMEKNMEAGVLINGGSIPIKLHKHLEALVTTKQLK
ncbi:MAG: DISARM system phospholipase D-like protein DrmC [Nitrospira sp.]|nr:DISARM system phospholipase D-like protein DrmC [Nitrospira sp.]